MERATIQKETNQKTTNQGRKTNWGLLLGAVFLMATSAIGPGFLTQTTVFTKQLGASFGFVILISILLDVGAQLNIWKIVCVSGKRGQEIANTVFPGLGYILSILIVIGGLAFNIGNVAGAGLGLNVLFGIDIKLGAIITGVISISIFLVKQAGKAMDNFAKIFGVIMVVLCIFVAISSNPPVGEAALRTFVPAKIDIMSIITLVGGTVGGYITFAGAHRLIDSGVKGEEAANDATKSSVTGLLVTAVMRIFLFLAALGVLYKGLSLDDSNPAASVFKLAAGQFGYKIFGIVMWSAATTSVIGAAYTSVSFIRSFSSKIEENYKSIIIAFIVFSTIIFAIVGQPVKVLVLVGALNGLILPISLSCVLLGAYNKKVVGEYKHPKWMAAFGIIVVAIMTYMSIRTLAIQLPSLF
ncbi:MAG: NRAMP family divalent metal transporter [Clostridiaceae bacterium]